jgi:hypothetical protein
MWRSRSVHAVATPGSFNGAVYGWAVTLESLAIVITVIAKLRRPAQILQLGQCRSGAAQLP